MLWKKRQKKIDLNEYDIVGTFKEGDKVMLNMETINRHYHFAKYSEDFKKWLNIHKDDIFTVEYDRSAGKGKEYVCFKEDETPIKWLIWTGFLRKYVK